MADTPPSPPLTFVSPLLKTANSISIPKADSTHNGYLSLTDFNLFTASILPSQTGNSGKYLTTNGTSTSWATVTAGVASVTATSPIISSGGSNPDISCQFAGAALPGCLSAGAQSIGGVKTFGSIINADGGIDRSTPGNLDIGRTSGNSVNVRIGAAPEVVQINGDIIGMNALAGGITTTGGINMNGYKITSLLPPTNPQDAATKGYVDSSSGTAVTSVTASSPLFSSGGLTPNITCQTSSGSLSGCLTSTDWNTFNNKQSAGSYVTALTGDVLATGPGSAASTISIGAVTDTKASLANKPAVAVVSTTNQTLSGLAVIDGISTAANTLVLLTAQTTASQNGPWTAQSGAWIRPSWYPAGGTTQAFQFITTLVRLGSTYSGTVWRLTTSGPITIDTTATTWVITKITLNPFTATQANSTTSGFLSALDWNIFNNKLSSSSGNYITNPYADVDTTGWNLYNNTGRTVPASVVMQDITYTSILSGGGGNGATISYIFHATQPSSTPLVLCPTGTSITVAWYNGPTLANNPTATQLKAAFDSTPCAVAIATSAITGTASNKQYETGTSTLANGGDTSPIDGTGGSITGVIFTRSLINPLIGIASFLLSKDAASRQGQGVSTDFVINSIDKGTPLQINFAYSGSSGMVLGTSSDARVFVYDVTNAVLIPVTPLATIAGPVSTAKTFVGQFNSSATSINYRLIVHIATTSTTAWDLQLDQVIVNDVLSPVAATQVPSVVLQSQPISGAVTDHMVVMWRDGATQWVPATIAGAAIPAFGTDKTQLGFATNIVGSTASIYIRGALDGFSFGPFSGYEQYIDNTAGLISPLPSPFNDTYVMVGMAISSTVLNIQFDVHLDAIANSAGTPLKGGLLSNSAVNDGTGDQVLTVGANGNVLVANSAAALGINWAPAVVAGTGLTYTTATRALALANLAGDVTGAPQTNTIAAATVTGKALTGFVSGSGTITAADTILTGFNKINGNVLLKANIAAPTLTGDVNLSTGNLLISTIGKGPQVKTGTNAKIGTAVLVAGTVTVANTSITANSRIFVTSNTDGGTPGFLRVSAKTVGTSFVITSSNAADTSTVAWYIVESIP